jgi:hypothetical protein
MDNIVFGTLVVTSVIVIVYLLWLMLIDPGYYWALLGIPNVIDRLTDPVMVDGKGNAVQSQGCVDDVCMWGPSDKDLTRMFLDEVNGTQGSAEYETASAFTKLLNQIFGRSNDGFSTSTEITLSIPRQSLRPGTKVNLFKITGNPIFNNAFTKGYVTKIHGPPTDWFIYVGNTDKYTPNGWEYVGEESGSVNVMMGKSRFLTDDQKFAAVSKYKNDSPEYRKLAKKQCEHLRYLHATASPTRKAEILAKMRQLCVEHMESLPTYGDNLGVFIPQPGKAGSGVVWDLFPMAGFGSRKKADKHTCPFGSDKCLTMWNTAVWNIPKVWMFNDNSAYNFDGRMITEVRT